MKLHCLGTAGYHPNEERQTSCYFLPESGIVLDAGTGMFRLPGLIQTDHLDILLSHAHLDHVVGLTFLLDILFQRPVQTVRVWGEAAKLHAIQTHLTSELIFPVALPVTWCPIDEQMSWQIEDTTVSWRPQTHPGGSVAYRLDWPSSDTGTRSFVYATDTTGADDESVLKWMTGADVLLHECNFGDDQKEWAIQTGHCWLGKVSEISKRVQPKRVCLTHMNPIADLELDAAQTSFDVPVEIVNDDQVIEF